MPTGAITSYIDVAQVVLYVFWIFFFGLILYLRREDRREGYPLVADPPERRRPRAYFWELPSPKTFLLPGGHTYTAPPGNPDHATIAAVPAAPWPGAPLVPTGDPMQDGVGPAAWANREDEPDRTSEGGLRIVPLRAAPDYFVEPSDPNPLGMQVVGTDGIVGGTVKELWIDLSEPQIRYLEVEAAGRTVLVPMTLAVVHSRARQVKVNSVLGAQIGKAPGIRNPNVVTKLEEDRICAYFAGGYMYATPGRSEPLI